jgi:malate synthase
VAEFMTVAPAATPEQAALLSDEALAFVAELHRRFDAPLRELLAARDERQAAFDAGALPGFLPETADVRAGDWTVQPAPADLADRRVEITGPVDRKMMINALNSGANVFMACFEDATTPQWPLLLQGQVNVHDAVRGTISFANPDGRTYELGDETATLIVRPRGLHLREEAVQVDGQAVAGPLVDAGLFLFHDAQVLLDGGSGPYLYVPKLESHLEARWWADVCRFAEERLGLPAGSIAVSVLVETVLAAFEMDEILYELRDRPVAMNAGRWDYIFSVIKKLRTRPDAVLPDRMQVTMTVPFMLRYAELLVATCHRRGAHAIGGMAAFVPSRRDEEVNRVAMAKVAEDKERDAAQGYDGSWVAHPDLVPVCKAAFDEKLGDRPNQLENLRTDVSVTEEEMRDFAIPGSTITLAGVRNDVGVALRYLDSWLRGVGAVAIHNLMEDAATAEISRSQVWQWIRHRATLDDGTVVTRELVEQILDEEVDAARKEAGDAPHRIDDARVLFTRVALGEDYVDFLTTAGLDLLATPDTAA